MEIAVEHCDVDNCARTTWAYSARKMEIAVFRGRGRAKEVRSGESRYMYPCDRRGAWEDNDLKRVAAWLQGGGNIPNLLPSPLNLPPFVDAPSSSLIVQVMRRISHPMLVKCIDIIAHDHTLQKGPSSLGWNHTSKDSYKIYDIPASYINITRTTLFSLSLRGVRFRSQRDIPFDF